MKHFDQSESHLHEQFLKNLFPSPRDFERRRNSRISRSVSVIIQPLDADFRPDGESFPAVSRDVCDKGMGILATQKLKQEYVKITLAECEHAALAVVCHNDPIGESKSVYLLGVEFLDSANNFEF